LFRVFVLSWHIQHEVQFGHATRKKLIEQYEDGERWLEIYAAHAHKHAKQIPVARDAARKRAA
jgi:hypothetical protein